ncbi:MAG TPA: lysophospholipid acyltransferase family protein [Polyangia bacterium]|jgi:1-acyl-sn-glycerol-3-phosphate acyltransferase|nr:lysophospholipid acyltransferase family protein [Polyangia bacterium]
MKVILFLVIWLRFVVAWGVNLLTGLLALLLVWPLGPERTWRLLAQRWARLVLWIERVRVDVVGEEHLATPAILIINHVSLIDAVYVPAVVPRTVKFVIKKELGQIPLWGWALRAAGAVLIDRKDPRGAIASIRDAVEHLPAGWSMIVFPEGTRSRDGQLHPFKKGAFHLAIESKLPMIPLGAAGPLDIVPDGTVLIRPGPVYVTVGAPIPTAHWTIETMEAHIAEARAAMAGCIEASERRRQADRGRMS